MMKFTYFRRKSFFSSLDPDEILVDSVSALRAGSGEGRLERPLERFSLFLFLLLVAAGILYLFSRAVVLQAVRGDEFFSRSQENRFSARPIFPPRGRIMDYSGKQLVENIPSFGIVFERDLFMEKGAHLEKFLRDLGMFLGKEDGFFFALGFPSDYDAAKLPPRIFIESDIPAERILSFAAALDRFPGLAIYESNRRKYADGYAFSHLLGFVGKISPEDIVKNQDLGSKESIGKSGIEAFYDGALRGKGGKKIVEVDVRGKESAVRFVEEPEAGSQLVLTVDSDLQRKAYEVLDHYAGGTRGASIVALDPQTGAVRALISYPSFDINRFGFSLSKEEFSRIAEDPLHPLFNRAISGEFPSGSTIKPVIAAAALEEHVIDPLKKIYDEGFIEVPNPYAPGEKTVFPDWRKHGWIDFYDAIALSANVYFYMVGGGYRSQPGLGIERIKKYAEAFGFGSLLGIDLPGEKSGLIPDPSLKPILEPKNPVWRIGDTYHVAIGQGGVEVTPLQMAAATAAIANGGKLYKPYVVAKIKNKEGEITQKIRPQVIREGIVSPENLAEVVRGMRQTVTAGTAGSLAAVPVPVAAKTGTAQSGAGLPHAWITAFAPAANPDLAVVVMVERAGEGATVAVPIARDILQWYYATRK